MTDDNELSKGQAAAAEMVMDALNDAYVKGMAAELLTDGELKLLDFVWISVRHRAGLTDPTNEWDLLLPSTWRLAAERVTAEQRERGKEAGT